MLSHRTGLGPLATLVAYALSPRLLRRMAALRKGERRRGTPWNLDRAIENFAATAAVLLGAGRRPLPLARRACLWPMGIGQTATDGLAAAGAYGPLPAPVLAGRHPAGRALVSDRLLLPRSVTKDTRRPRRFGRPGRRQNGRDHAAGARRVHRRAGHSHSAFSSRFSTYT